MNKLLTFATAVAITIPVHATENIQDKCLDGSYNPCFPDSNCCNDSQVIQCSDFITEKCQATTWRACPDKPGVEQYTSGTMSAAPECKCTLQPATQMRCAKGWYGIIRSNATCDTITCTQCPEPGTTDLNLSNIIISQCFIPANTELTDDTGTYIYTENCSYTSK